MAEGFAPVAILYGRELVAVIPGRHAVTNPESITPAPGLWIPGPLALLASRNDDARYLTTPDTQHGFGRGRVMRSFRKQRAAPPA
jgi:hypothetical protein